MSDIFICYSRTDSIVAKCVAECLRAQGWSVFLDVQTPVGKRWHKEIEKELYAAKAVIALWSAKSRDSDFVLEEAEYAKRKERLFPAFIEQVEYPYGFRRIQTADLIGWTGEQEHPGLTQLLTSLRLYLDVGETPQARIDPAQVAVMQPEAVQAPTAQILPGQTLRDKLKAGGEGPLRELFAQQLRQAYETTVPRKTTDATSAHVSPAPNAPRAFVSYASEDREAVEALAEKLEARGIRVWQDKQDLRAGDNWNQVLVDVIARRVDYVVVVQTPVMTTATKGVFFREIDAALLRQAEMGEFDGQKLRFLVPVQIGACAPLSSLKAYHVIDVSEADGMDLLIKSILEDWDRRAGLRSRSQGVA